MLIVVVEFIIDPERLAEFMPLMLNNARTSLAEEPGCHQFEVCASEEAREAKACVSAAVGAKAVTGTFGSIAALA